MNLSFVVCLACTIFGDVTSKSSDLLIMSEKSETTAWFPSVSLTQAKARVTAQQTVDWVVEYVVLFFQGFPEIICGSVVCEAAENASESF